MNRFFISAFAACIAVAAPTALWAADDHHDQGGASHGTSSQGSHDTGGSHGTTTGSGTHGSTGGGTHHDRTVRSTTRTSRTTGTTHHTTRHLTTTNHHTTTHRTTNVTRNVTTNVHATVDVASFHKNFDAPHAFHNGDYHGPEGYAYHRWGFGDNLPREYWAQNYWIGDYLSFGLIGPPGGYTWVRYGPDAVLVDENTGNIIQVEYGVFD
jgi:Ni/Co efflux regulator RcnB